MHSPPLCHLLSSQICSVSRCFTFIFGSFWRGKRGATWVGIAGRKASWTNRDVCRSPGSLADPPGHTRQSRGIRCTVSAPFRVPAIAWSAAVTGWPDPSRDAGCHLRKISWRGCFLGSCCTSSRSCDSSWSWSGRGDPAEAAEAKAFDVQTAQIGAVIRHFVEEKDGPVMLDDLMPGPRAFAA